MTQKVLPKRSWTANAVPTSSDLVNNEIAINWADLKLYSRNPSTGEIVTVSLGGGSGGSANIVTASTAAGFPSSGASGTLYVATDSSRAYQWSGSVYVEIGPGASSGGTGGTGGTGGGTGGTGSTGGDTGSTGGTGSTSGGTGGTGGTGGGTGGTGGTGGGTGGTGGGTGGSSSPDVALLIQGGSGIFDASSHTRTVTNHDCYLTSTAKFGNDTGTGGIGFGNGAYLEVPAGSWTAFGTGDWTFEAWLNHYNLDAANGILGGLSSTTGAPVIKLVNSNGTKSVRCYNQSGTLELDVAHSMTTSTWYHFAVCRSGGYMRAFVDGVPLGSAASSTAGNYTANFLGVGLTSTSVSEYFNGVMDDIRIVSGTAMFALNSSFTPPTSAY
jgi:hypothetical protein